MSIVKKSVLRVEETAAACGEVGGASRHRAVGGVGMRRSAEYIGKDSVSGAAGAIRAEGKGKALRALWLAMLASLLLVFVQAVRADAAWEQTANGWRYTVTESPGYLTGKVQIDSTWYYFDENGIMQTNYFATVNEHLYYFGNDGKMQIGWITTEDGTKYYARKSNGTLYGALYVSQWYGKYYFQSDGSMATSTWVGNKWVNSKGKYTGKKRSGFVTWNGNTYYYKTSSSSYSTGWFKVSGKYYYANSDGIVQKSTWVGKKYVNSKGVMVTGKKTISGKTYIFRSKSGTRYANRWVKYKNKYYYCGSGGVVQKSTWIDSKYYVNSKGVRVTGWQTIDGSRYYFSSKGVKQTGVKKLSGKYYYFASDGALVTSGWASTDYYAGSNGVLVTGLQEIDGEIYYFSTSTCKKITGKMKKVGSSTYYFSEDNGTAVRSQEVCVNGKYYYFGSDATMVTNQWIDQNYYGSDGARTETRTTGWVNSGTATYYLDSSYKHVTGWMYKTDENGVRNKYYLDPDADGAMVTGVKTIGSNKYYFYSSGAMATSTTITVGTVQYTISASGVITSESSISVSGSTTGTQIVNYALQFVGNPYVYGGTSLTNGADCSGYTYSVFANFGIKLLRTADEQMDGPSASQISSGYTAGVEVSLDSIQPGDLLFYGTTSYASHVAIYIGNGQIVHASNSQAYPAGGIKISNYDYRTPVKAMRYWS
ncbi:MAG: NlpC/P60 family protein [Lachnospiraceae bacterium]|nr:NlpC/P60 family protein [Lachnospiraceae bacterium]